MNSNSLEQILICTSLLRREYKITFLVPFDVNGAFYVESLQASTAPSVNSSGKMSGGLVDHFPLQGPQQHLSWAKEGLCPSPGQSQSWGSRQAEGAAIISSEMLTLGQKGIIFPFGNVLEWDPCARYPSPPAQGGAFGVPCSVLQCHGTFSDPLESCQLQ